MEVDAQTATVVPQLLIDLRFTVEVSSNEYGEKKKKNHS